MGKAMEVLSGFATAPGAAQTNLTLSAGTSLQVRNAPVESRVMLLQVWADVQAAGVLRVRSPQLHDNVQGLRFGTVISEAKPLLPDGCPQYLVPQDTLTVDISGSAVAGDIESAALLVYYDDLTGADANFGTYEEIFPRIENIVTVENTLALGTGGGLSGEEALSAEFNLLRANTEYALLGYEVDVECLLVGWRGADTSNLRVAGPGDELGRDYTRNWFVNLSKSYGIPAIPIFNSSNIAAILVDGVQDENGADPRVTSIFAELAG